MSFKLLKNRFIRNFALLSLILGCYQVSFAHELDGKPLVKLTTGSDYAPYTSHRLPNGGLVSEVVIRVLQEAGYQTELVFQPWARGLKSTKRHESTVTFPYAWNEERAADFLYSRPVNTIQIRPFRHIDREDTFNGPDDLAGLVYCQPHGYHTEPELVKMMDENKLVRFKGDTMVHCFQMLEKKHVDIVISNDLVARDSIRKAVEPDYVENIVGSKKPYRQTTEHLIISKTYPDAQQIIDKFNQTYQRLLDSGEIDKMWQKRLQMNSGHRDQ